MNVEWAHALAAIIGALFGAAGSIFTGGFRLGKIESRLKLHFNEAVSESEKRIEAKVGEAQHSFDETLKGLRQKINDVELETVRGFVAKGDFDDFRAEYREDMRDLKKSISEIPRTH